MPTYRILSVDGGGIRGLLSAVLLQRLAQQVPAFLDRVDLFAGTSTGAIVVLGLTAGVPIEDLIDLYQNQAAQVFDSSWLHNIQDLGGLRGAKYDNVKLKALLTAKLGAKTLNDLTRKVIVPTFDLDGTLDGQRVWKPKFFHNYPGPESDGAELAVDVAMRSSAAPTYFPIYQHYIDGVTVANDPSMAALAQAIDPGTGNQALADLRLFSVGTGLNPTFVDAPDADWGVGQWGPIFASMMIDGVMGVAEYQCLRLLKDRYFRLQPLLPKPIALDAISGVNDLIQYATNAEIAPAVDWIDQVFLN